MIKNIFLIIGAVVAFALISLGLNITANDSTKIYAFAVAIALMIGVIYLVIKYSKRG